jgi:hypothetical protein
MKRYKFTWICQRLFKTVNDKKMLENGAVKQRDNKKLFICRCWSWKLVARSMLQYCSMKPYDLRVKSLFSMCFQGEIVSNLAESLQVYVDLATFIYDCQL